MLGLGWLALRQAQEALKSGRLEEALRLLSEPAAQGHKRSFELLRELALAFAGRGERHLRQNDPVAAWNDLLLAEQAAGAEKAVERLREVLTARGLAEVRALLDAGEPDRALEAAAHLRERAVHQPPLDTLEEAAKGWLRALQLAGRGDFPQALQALQRARKQLPGPAAALERLHKEMEERGRAFSALLVKLHEAVNRKDWNDVMQRAEAALALAPNHPEARKARDRAWKAVEPTTIILARPASPEPPAPAPEPPKRFLLWIDGVGGYLVCLGNRVSLGQALPDTPVDVPIFADVSRLHATLTRDSEGYLLEAARSARVNGLPVERALLHPGDRVTLGKCCQFQFLQPVPVSASARLDLVSGHRLRLAVDGVLLMAETLILGPGPQAHVVVPDLEKPVILYRAKEGLGISYPGRFTVDGQPCNQRGTLGPSSAVKGDDFSLAVEAVGLRLGSA